MAGLNLRPFNGLDLQTATVAQILKASTPGEIFSRNKNDILVSRNMALAELMAFDFTVHDHTKDKWHKEDVGATSPTTFALLDTADATGPSPTTNQRTASQFQTDELFFFNTISLALNDAIAAAAAPTDRDHQEFAEFALLTCTIQGKTMLEKKAVSLPAGWGIAEDANQGMASRHNVWSVPGGYLRIAGLESFAFTLDLTGATISATTVYFQAIFSGLFGDRT